MATTGPEPDQSEAAQLARALELRTAERDGVLVLLGELVDAIERHGGYLVTADQFSLSEAKYTLEKHGIRKAKPRATWRDRR